MDSAGALCFRNWLWPEHDQMKTLVDQRISKGDPALYESLAFIRARDLLQHLPSKASGAQINLDHVRLNIRREMKFLGDTHRNLSTYKNWPPSPPSSLRVSTCLNRLNLCGLIPHNRMFLFRQNPPQLPSAHCFERSSRCVKVATHDHHDTSTQNCT